MSSLLPKQFSIKNNNKNNEYISELVQNLPIELVFLIIGFMDPHVRLRILKQKYTAKYIKQRLLRIPRTPSNIAKIFNCFQLMKDMVQVFNDDYRTKYMKDFNYTLKTVSELSLGDLLEEPRLHEERLLKYNEMIEKKNVLEKRRQKPDKRRRGKIYQYFLNCNISNAKKNIIYYKKWVDKFNIITGYISLISQTISQFKKIHSMNMSESEKINSELLLFKIYKQVLLI